MTNEELVRAALEKVGGKSNVLTATNCMTRLRVRVKEDAKIDDEGLKAIEGVMGIVHDRAGYVEIVVGPGKCRKCADICRDMGIPADAAASTANDWQTNKAAVKAGQKQSKVKELFKTFGDIFIPLIPGVVASGLCAGINSLIGQVVPNYADIPALALISTLLGLMNTCFLGYLTAWVGFCILLMIFHWCHYMQFPLKSLVVVVIYVISYRSNQRASVIKTLFIIHFSF